MVTTISKQLAEQIRKRRIEQDITLQQIEDLCGVQRSHLSNIENGKIKPSLNTIERIIQALNANVEIKLN